jgi:prevent-host-death family protein
MTTYDYYVVMSAVRIAELKSRLSQYLRRVQRGHALTVMDRETPIARIVPYESGPGPLVIRRPEPGAPELQKVLLPPPLKVSHDIVELLLEERQTGR